jgi:mTERF
VGLFDLLRLQLKIKASDVVEIIDHFPQFVLQNRKDLLRKKIDLIRKHNKGLTDTYIKNLVKRHPDLFLKSWASMEAKVNYVTKNLGRPLHKEKSFPLMLQFNYN